MNYFDLLKARRKSVKTPTLEQRQWSAAQLMRMGRGLCVQCGERPPTSDSYLCTECQATDTLEDILSELHALRDRLLLVKGE